MHFKSKLWAGSHLRMLLENTPGETQQMAVVARKLERMAACDDLTSDEVEFRNELQLWLDAKNAEFEVN